MKNLSNLYKKPLIWLVGVTLLAGAAGCTREETDTPTPPDGEKVNVEFRLGVESMKSVVPRSTTKSVEADGAGLQITFGQADETAVTRSPADETITSLWVFQYAKSGQYAGQLIAYDDINSNRLTETGDGTYAFSAKLAWSDDCEVFVVANSDNFGYDQSLTSLSAARTKLYTSSFNTNPNANPMTGIYTGAVPNDYVWVPMTRLKAKISLDIVDNTPNKGVRVYGVRLNSIPSKVRYYDRATYAGEPDWIFPEAVSDATENNRNFSNYPQKNGSDLNQTIVWQVAENRQGNASPRISSPKGKWMGASPTYNIDGEQTSYATHIVIQGIYNDGTDTKPFEITFFPGDQDDLNNNFDIVRNTHYIITATITNFDKDDPRIEIEEPGRYINFHFLYGDEGHDYSLSWEIPHGTTIDRDFLMSDSPYFKSEKSRFAEEKEYEGNTYEFNRYEWGTGTFYSSKTWEYPPTGGGTTVDIDHSLTEDITIVYYYDRKPAPSYNYVVKYYKESLQGEWLGDSSGTAEEGTEVGDLLDEGTISLHDFAPPGYTYAGVVDPSSATVISSDETSNVIYVVYKYSYIVLRYILLRNDTEETELQPDDKYTVPPGAYGPYTPPDRISGANYDRLGPGGIPVGDIGPGETITITFIYTPGVN